MSVTNRHRMRCNACRATGRSSGRFTLSRRPDQYVRKPRCPQCGEQVRIVSVEHQRLAEMKKRDLCRCAGLDFPHARATHKKCVHHVNYREMAAIEGAGEDDDYE